MFVKSLRLKSDINGRVENIKFHLKCLPCTTRVDQTIQSLRTRAVTLYQVLFKVLLKYNILAEP